MVENACKVCIYAGLARAGPSRQVPSIPLNSPAELLQKLRHPLRMHFKGVKIAVNGSGGDDLGSWGCRRNSCRR